MVKRMKTTLELPDAVYRQIKARAALKGQSIKAFFLDAIRDKLALERANGAKKAGWRAAFGKVRAEDVAEVQQIIDEEFSQIRQEDWT
jgi:hypothetical protein